MESSVERIIMNSLMRWTEGLEIGNGALSYATPPTLCDPKQYGKNAKINILQDDGEYKAHTIAEYNKIIQEFLDAMPEVVKVPILVEDDTIGWSAEGRPEVCKYQGFFY